MEIASIVKKFIGLAQRQFAGKPVTAPEVRMLNKEFYQGLKLQVSFSKMQDTEVAWLAFLAEGQSVRRGIFPLLLYFKELNALLLAFGQSETYPPDQPWQVTQLPALSSYFKRKKIPWKNSLVLKSYAPGEIAKNEQPLLRDLDELIRFYFAQFAGNVPSVVAEPDQMTQNYQPQQLSLPLNLILYGPPGTGKTYHAIHYAVAIIENLPVEVIARQARDKAVSRYHEYRQQGRIEFITFHQNYAYEDFVQGLKPDASGGQLRFKVKDGIFKCLADRARKQYEAYHHQPQKARRTFEDLLHLTLAKNVNPETEEIEFHLEESHRIYKSIIVYEVTPESLVYKRRTQRDIINHEERRELNIHKIRELYEGHEIKESINHKYYEAVVQTIINFEEELTEEQEEDELKNYVLVIDEINRANISRVFGELITLIEKDKRCGQENEMSVTLPSGESFSVPPNLYLVGTMNTADKSIALLDIALRRRFRFFAMYPDEEMLRAAQPALADLLARLNEEILREKKSEDFLIGHSFFTGRTQADLPEIFDQQIIPLLLEYFPGRRDAVMRLLGSAGIKTRVENYQLKFEGLTK